MIRDMFVTDDYSRIRAQFQEKWALRREKPENRYSQYCLWDHLNINIEFKIQFHIFLIRKLNNYYIHLFLQLIHCLCFLNSLYFLLLFFANVSFSSFLLFYIREDICLYDGPNLYCIANVFDAYVFAYCFY